ncbi:nucleotidyltransferase [Micromonospora sp. AMSO12t]|uniref:nucleotidyltransferase n=1 Tax=Micromonospora sp. AMSO12t TaxID=2650410 RepID=UPI00139E7DFC|nr:nucleotidyltransferase [Micromonospora sp. AMSO12t]KAB1153088.1 nucleotidyltransferase [Micromonospora sp. AMSO12t]
MAIADPLLSEIERRIAITPTEQAEAQRRLDYLVSTLAEEFEGEVYVNGSIIHGDGITPLNDIDLGVIFGEPTASRERFGSPASLVGAISREIEVRARSRGLHIATSLLAQKRAIVITFGEHEGAASHNFTADVIVALEYPDGPGILVPNLQSESWDRSDPMAHTEMILQANRVTGFAFNKIVRLVKHWNRATGKPLSSWNIKALALGCITHPLSLTQGVQVFFGHAVESLEKGLTPDPAGVALPANLELPRPQVMSRLHDAHDRVNAAILCATRDDVSGWRELIEEVFPIPEPAP